MGRNSSELGMSESYNIVPNGLLALTNLSATFVDNHLTVRLDDWSPNTASHHIQGLFKRSKEEKKHLDDFGDVTIFCIENLAKVVVFLNSKGFK